MMPPSIVDAHVHLWNPKQLNYAWLASRATLNRAFLPTDFAATPGTASVHKMIFVECSCEPAQSLAEADWVSALAKNEPHLKGIVAHAALDKGTSIRTDLQKLAARPLVKGIRRNLQGEHAPGFCLQPDFIAGIQLLAEFNFTFDVCIRHEQLPDITELVRRAPKVMFVLDHFGKPDVKGKKLEPWAKNLKALAALPNVVCKISGLSTEAQWESWQPADLKEYFRVAFECFGFDRVLFGGDWPVATLATTYQRWVETVQEMTVQASEADRRKLFQTNAERIYRV